MALKDPFEALKQGSRRIGREGSIESKPNLMEFKIKTEGGIQSDTEDQHWQESGKNLENPARIQRENPTSADAKIKRIKRERRIGEVDEKKGEEEEEDEEEEEEEEEEEAVEEVAKFGDGHCQKSRRGLFSAGATDVADAIEKQKNYRKRRKRETERKPSPPIDLFQQLPTLFIHFHCPFPHFIRESQENPRRIPGESQENPRRIPFSY